MNAGSLTNRFAAVCTFVVCVSGCTLFKPSGLTPRTFVLTPVPAESATSSAGSTNMIIGMKLVKMPGYLTTKSFAVRRNHNEIVYLESVAWAERLDTAVQRVLAANLCALIPTDQARLSLWGAETVSVQVEVSVEQFDVDSSGNAVLRAWWRLLSAGGDVIASGRFSATRKGPSPEVDPGGAASSMSGLAGDFAASLVRAIKRESQV